jgi:hypothetical protein
MGSPVPSRCTLGSARPVKLTLVADDREVAVAARMRELRAAGKSYREIAGQLNVDGMTSKRGGVWCPLTVRRVLTRQEAAR